MDLELEESNTHSEDYQQQICEDHQYDVIEDESEFLFDKETIKFIEGLRDEFGFEGDIDPYEFLQKIQNELNNGVVSEKQRMALEELKRWILEDLAQCPIPLDELNENEYFDESEESEEISPESHYSLFSQMNKNIQAEQIKNYKDDLKFALWGNNSNSSKNYFNVENFDNEYSNIYQKLSSEIDLKHNLRQVEIVDSLKPQFYFNANKNKFDLEKMRMQDSDQDSKESTSKTPCFIGTPTSGSQLGSLNNTGAVRAEDLDNAMKRLAQTSDIKKYVEFSSSNSSRENLNKVHGPHFKPVMSFGGHENIIWNPSQSDIIVKEYENDENTVEYDTFRV